MSTPSPRRGNLLTVTFVLLLSVLFEQYGIAPFLPWTNSAGTFRPMIVFLDIPLALPEIHWLPVSLLFVIFYCVAARQQVWKALTAWWIFLGCIAAGGGLYMFVEGYLPKQVANGIDSFGVRADLTLPYPSGEVIHLHGSMFMLAFALAGAYFMVRRAAIPHVTEIPADSTVGSVPALASRAGTAAVAEAQAIINSPVSPVKPPVIKKPAKESVKEPAREPVRQPIAEAVLADGPEPPASWATTQKQSSVSVTMPSVRPPQQPLPRREPEQKAQLPQPAQQPVQGPAFPGEPPTCRLTTPPPVAMIMPRPAPGIGKVHPCIVIGSLKPT